MKNQTRNVLRGLCSAGLFIGLSSFASAATTTIIGVISDDCDAATHTKIMSMHKTSKMTDHNMAMACVKGGGRYVFVADGNIYQIANQNHVGLAKGAGNWVSLTGVLNEAAITVTEVVIATIVYTGDGNLGGGGDSVCQEYFGPEAFDITTADGGGRGGTVCAIYPDRAR